jgi:hypothetical protein
MLKSFRNVSLSGDFILVAHPLSAWAAADSARKDFKGFSFFLVAVNNRSDR